ncbi:hypothetical protein IF650_05810 [Cellulosimicrobium terreum]|nr:hypothetical protein [Cellulosimicrobium terreum]
MRKYLAATAALSCALLLASCASTTDPSSETETPEPTATQAEAPEPTIVSIEQSCAGFYDGGAASLAARVDDTFALTAEELTDESSLTLATTRDKIASIQRFADVEVQENLNGIKAPFQAALEATEVVTTNFQPSLDAFHAQCDEAGYEFTS